MAEAAELRRLGSGARMFLLQIALLSALVAIALVFAREAQGLVETSGPYPLIVLGAIVVLTVATLARLVAGRQPFRTGAEIGTLASGGPDRQLRFALVSGTWIAYAAILPVAGFVLATAAALFVTIAVAGFRRPVALAVGALVFAILITVLVKTVLYVAVPESAIEAWIERALFRLRN